MGGLLRGLLSPAGLVVIAVGLIAGGLKKITGNAIELGRELGTIQETLGLVSTSGFQVLARSIEETNGSADGLEKTMLRARDTIGSALDGNKQAADSFAKLNIPLKELEGLSPDQALIRIITAANDSLGPTEAAAVLSDVLGRSYSDLGGITALTSDQMKALLVRFGDADTASQGLIDATNLLDEEQRQLGATFGESGNKIAEIWIRQKATWLDNIALILDAVGVLKNGIIDLGHFLGFWEKDVEGAATAGEDLASVLDGETTPAVADAETASADLADTLDNRTTPAVADAGDAAGDATPQLTALSEAEELAAQEAKDFAKEVADLEKELGRSLSAYELQLLANEELQKALRKSADVHEAETRRMIEASQTRAANLPSEYVTALRARGD